MAKTRSLNPIADSAAEKKTPASAFGLGGGLLSEKTIRDTSQPDNKELGVTGLIRYGRTGQVFEEFLPELSGYRARKVYREMRDNDPVVGAFMFTIELLLRNVAWEVEGKNKQATDFVEECIEDMSHTWADLIAEVFSMLTFGYSYHEIVYKLRKGPDQEDPAMRSKYKDGKIGWRKLPIRAQDTLMYWEFDDDGGVKGFWQLAPPSYVLTFIPIERALLFRTTSHKNNPEGRSVLRNAYRPWWFKKRIEEIEGIGLERDLAGLPVIYRNAEVASKFDEEFKKILRNVRRDEQEGLLLPLVYDEGGHKMCEFSLINSGGSRQFDTSSIIDRYNKTIAMTVLADFLLLGQAGVGSFALAETKTSLFTLALGAFMSSVAEVFNRYAIPRLLTLNKMKVDDDPPKLKPGNIEKVDLQKIADFITKLASSGATIFPDDELENFLRKLAKLPLKPEDPGLNIDTAGLKASPGQGQPQPQTPGQTQPPVPGQQPPQVPAPKPAPDKAEQDAKDLVDQHIQQAGDKK